MLQLFNIILLFTVQSNDKLPSDISTKVFMHFLRPSRILYDFPLHNSISFISPLLKDLMESKSCKYHTKI